MFNGRLCDFQTEHEENLLNKCADHEEMVLYAPTGSGKTVMVCKFIDDYLDENPDTVFLWLCPGAGGLHKQSQDSFDELQRAFRMEMFIHLLVNQTQRAGVFHKLG